MVQQNVSFALKGKFYKSLSCMFNNEYHLKKKKLYTFKEGGASIKGFYLQVMFHCLMIKKNFR